MVVPPSFLYYMQCPNLICMEGHTAIANQLAKRVKQFEATASEHRLNQRPQNSSLKSAESVKEKLANLKKQAKTERIDIAVQLWIYLEGKSTPRKVYSLQFLIVVLCSNICPRPNCHLYPHRSKTTRVPTTFWMPSWGRLKPHMILVPLTVEKTVWKSLALNGKSIFLSSFKHNLIF